MANQETIPKPPRCPSCGMPLVLPARGLRDALFFRINYMIVQKTKDGRFVASSRCRACHGIVQWSPSASLWFAALLEGLVSQGADRPSVVSLLNILRQPKPKKTFADANEHR